MSAGSEANTISINFRDSLLALFAVFVLGLNVIAIKVAVADMPPLFVTGIRFTIVSMVAVWFFPIPRTLWKPILILSVIQGLIHHGVMFIGMTGVDVAIGAIVMQLSIPFAVLMAWLVLGETFGWRRTVGITTALGGVAILVGEPQVQSAWFFVLLLIISSAAWAYANIHVKRMGDVNIMQIIVWMSVLATPQLFIASAFLETGQIEALYTAPLKAWGGVLFSALGSTLVGYGIWYNLIAKYSVSQIAPLGLLNPVIAVTAGVILLDEVLSIQKVIGGCVILIGVMIIQLRTKRLK